MTYEEYQIEVENLGFDYCDEEYIVGAGKLDYPFIIVGKDNPYVVCSDDEEFYKLNEDIAYELLKVSVLLAFTPLNER